MNVVEFEHTFWNIYKEVDHFRDIVPLNAESEKIKFFQKSGSYNPQFIYREIDFSKSIEDLNLLYPYCSELPGIISIPYKKLIENLSNWINQFSLRDEGFNQWLFDLHGSPSSEDVLVAEEILNKPREKVVSEDINNAPFDFFTQKLNELGFKDWSISSTEMPAKIRISSIEKIIYIDKNAVFTNRDLKRLSVHEIETHVLRHENGRKQPYLIFQYGFPDYLETEEGLAIFSEDNTGLLSNDDLRKYSLRLLASSLVSTMNFKELFGFLENYTDTEEAYGITLRVKRGLCDTNLLSGYTKDQVYLSGLLKLRKLTREEVLKLYVGKIGIQNLRNIESADLNPANIIPKWIN